MAQRVLTTELMILEALLDGEYTKAGCLMLGMSHAEMARFETIADDLVKMLGAHMRQIEERERNQTNERSSPSV